MKATSTHNFAATATLALMVGLGAPLGANADEAAAKSCSRPCLTIWRRRSPSPSDSIPIFEVDYTRQAEALAGELWHHGSQTTRQVSRHALRRICNVEMIFDGKTLTCLGRTPISTLRSMRSGLWIISLTNYGTSTINLFLALICFCPTSTIS